jgi:hypothetical protein
VGVWKLIAVEDEIVVATHGRGIWSTTDPALLNGSSYKPLFQNAAQIPSGELRLDFNLRSAYDSTQVWIDGTVATTLPANIPLQLESLDLPVLTSGTRTIFARAFQGGSTFDSVTRMVDVSVLAAPVFEYTNILDNDIDGDDFQRDGFFWSAPAGFSDGGLHTAHFYPDGSGATAMLLTPIRISQLTTLSFDEVAIVEPGDPGSIFGDSNFWDYVIVEGSADGVNWLPLLPGYDARDDTAWLSAYNSSSSGNSSMFRNRSLTLNDTFSQGQTVLLRFRLFADGFVNAWGWAIDNVDIISQGVSAAGDVPGPVTLAQNYPNPFNPRTTIAFNLQKAGRVKLQVYDLRGRLVRTLVDEPRGAGEHRVVWDGLDRQGSGSAAGMYFYRLETGGEVMQQKMTLLK